VDRAAGDSDSSVTASDADLPRTRMCKCSMQRHVSDSADSLTATRASVRVECVTDTRGTAESIAGGGLAVSVGVALYSHKQ
jgi:hypothetical protein